VRFIRIARKTIERADIEQWQLYRFNTDDTYDFFPIELSSSVATPLRDYDFF